MNQLETLDARPKFFTAMKNQVVVLWVVTPWRRGPPKVWYPVTILHGITSRKPMIIIFVDYILQRSLCQFY